MRGRTAHARASTSIFDLSLLGNHNFCRNPNNSPRPWCFVGPEKTEDCDISFCEHDESPSILEPPSRITSLSTPPNRLSNFNGGSSPQTPVKTPPEVNTNNPSSSFPEVTKADTKFVLPEEAEKRKVGFCLGFFSISLYCKSVVIIQCTLNTLY